MITLADAIDEARDGHPAFTERNVPSAVVRRRLKRYQRELYAVVVENDPQWTAGVQTITLSSYDFDTGYTPDPAMLKPLGGEVHFETGDRTSRLKWVPYKNRKRPTVPWPAYYLDGVIYLCGIADDWQAVTTVDLHLIEEPTALTQPSDTFDLPEGAVPAIINRAEYEMAKRSPMTAEGQQPNVEAFQRSYERAEQRFIDELEERDRAEESYVREEW